MCQLPVSATVMVSHAGRYIPLQDNVVQLLELAHKYDIAVVRGYCGHFLASNTSKMFLSCDLDSPRNVLRAASLAHWYLSAEDVEHFNKTMMMALDRALSSIGMRHYCSDSKQVLDYYLNTEAKDPRIAQLVAGEVQVSKALVRMSVIYIQARVTWPARECNKMGDSGVRLGNVCNLSWHPILHVNLLCMCRRLLVLYRPKCVVSHTHRIIANTHSTALPTVTAKACIHAYKGMHTGTWLSTTTTRCCDRPTGHCYPDPDQGVQLAEGYVAGLLQVAQGAAHGPAARPSGTQLLAIYVPVPILHGQGYMYGPVYGIRMRS